MAGGMESMTQAPYLLPGARAGYRHRRRHAGRLDDVRRPVLRLRPRAPWASSTEQLQREGRRSRASARTPSRPLSHEKAAAAIKDGRLAEEIVAGAACPSARATRIVVDTDEGVRPETTAESLGTLRPAFDKDGTITAGNASQISDGGAAVIVMSRAKAEELGRDAARRARQLRQVAGPDTSLLHPAVAGHPRRCAEGRHRRSAAIDLFEINEAFAAVGLASTRRPRDRPRTRSTSTAAPSPSATRSACRAPGSPSRAARAAPPRRLRPPWRSAAVAARATPPSCAPSEERSAASAPPGAAGSDQTGNDQEHGAHHVHTGADLEPGDGRAGPVRAVRTARATSSAARDRVDRSAGGSARFAHRGHREHGRRQPHIVKASASHSCVMIHRLSAVIGSNPARTLVMGTTWAMRHRARRAPMRSRPGSSPWCPWSRRDADLDQVERQYGGIIMAISLAVPLAMSAHRSALKA